MEVCTFNQRRTAVEDPLPTCYESIEYRIQSLKLTTCESGLKELCQNSAFVFFLSSLDHPRKGGTITVLKISFPFCDLSYHSSKTFVMLP